MNANWIQAAEAFKEDLQKVRQSLPETPEDPVAPPAEICQKVATNIVNILEASFDQLSGPWRTGGEPPMPRDMRFHVQEVREPEQRFYRAFRFLLDSMTADWKATCEKDAVFGRHRAHQLGLVKLARLDEVGAIFDLRFAPFRAPEAEVAHGQ